MHLHRRLGAAKWCPWKQRQAEIYCGGVQCINGVVEVEPEFFFGAERAGLCDQPMRELGIDSPVSSFVGIWQGRAPDRRTNAHVVQLGPFARRDTLRYRAGSPCRSTAQTPECENVRRKAGCEHGGPHRTGRRFGEKFSTEGSP